jgi:DNA primase
VLLIAHRYSYRPAEGNPDRKSITQLEYEEAGRKPTTRGADRTAAAPRRDPAAERPDPRDPTLWPQREALKSALQCPALAGPVFDALTGESFTHPGYAAVRNAIEQAGGTSSGLTGAQWMEAVREQAGTPALVRLLSELAVETINVDADKLPRYIAGVLARLQEVWVGRQIAEVKSKLQRMSPVDHSDDYHALFGDLVALEAYRRSLLEQASGDDLTA